MHETLNHAKLAMLFRKEFELCNVTKGETVVLLSDLGARRDYVSAAFAAAEDFGADAYEMMIEIIEAPVSLSTPRGLTRSVHASPSPPNGRTTSRKARSQYPAMGDRSRFEVTLRLPSTSIQYSCCNGAVNACGTPAASSQSLGPQATLPLPKGKPEGVTLAGSPPQARLDLSLIIPPSSFSLAASPAHPASAASLAVRSGRLPPHWASPHIRDASS